VTTHVLDRARAADNGVGRARQLPSSPVAVLLVDAGAFIDPPDETAPHTRQVRRAAAVADCIRQRLDPLEVSFSDRSRGELIAVVRCEDDGDDPVERLKRRAAELRTHLQEELHAELPVAVGLPHAGSNAPTRSYQDARAALTLAEDCAGTAGVCCLDQIGLAGLVDAPTRASRRLLAARLLASLQREPQLEETLRVYFACGCSPSETASQLGLHRNTLAYRLQRIAKLTGRHPAHFEDAVQLRIALHVVGDHPSR
jgi:sugar diacid utilization regulator